MGQHEKMTLKSIWRYFKSAGWNCFQKCVNYYRICFSLTVWCLIKENIQVVFLKRRNEKLSPFTLFKDQNPCNQHLELALPRCAPQFLSISAGGAKCCMYVGRPSRPFHSSWDPLSFQIFTSVASQTWFFFPALWRLSLMEKRMVPFVSKGCNFTRQWLLDEIDFLPPTHCTFVSRRSSGSQSWCATPALPHLQDFSS